MGDFEVGTVDEDYLWVLEYGMLLIGGLGIGIDWVVMFLVGVVSIKEIIFFLMLCFE